LEKIVTSRDLLYSLKDSIDRSANLIDQISDEDILEPLAQVVSPAKENINLAKTMIDKALPMLDIIPRVAGYPTEKKYLFLLQNNSELRPTGGFIGTYGILKMKDGEIAEFKTDNIYNLDAFVEGILDIKPPAPMVKYLTQDHWYMRDSNWSPDWPTAAQKAEEFYNSERDIIANLDLEEARKNNEKIKDITPLYEQSDVDGVIAVTPELITDLLKITGPITVGGIRFTDENLVDELEFRVGKEYAALGISDANRKEIIRSLADQIKAKLLAMPYHQLIDIVDLVAKALDQKEVLIYDKDPSLQALIDDRNWSGRVRATDGDYFYIVDTNLASLKTDQVIGRYAKYSISRKNGDLIATLESTYSHTGSFNWKTTRLRNYVRVYVPAGSELISSTGFTENDKLFDPARTARPAEVYNELGKTVFAGFISIEPHETGTFTLTYKLPQSIKQKFDQSSYSLLVQKQPGTNRFLTFDLKFGKNIESAYPAEDKKQWFNTTYNLSNLILTEDQWVVIRLNK